MTAGPSGAGEPRGAVPGTPRRPERGAAVTGATESTPAAGGGRVPVLNAANALTALRLVLVPVFVALVVVLRR